MTAEPRVVKKRRLVNLEYLGPLMSDTSISLAAEKSGLHNFTPGQDGATSATRVGYEASSSTAGAYSTAEHLPDPMESEFAELLTSSKVPEPLRLALPSTHASLTRSATKHSPVVPNNKRVPLIVANAWSLDLPKAEKLLTVKLKRSDTCAINLVQAKNDTTAQACRLLGYSASGQTKEVRWTLFVKNTTVRLLAANHKRIAAACTNKSVILVNTATGVEEEKIESLDDDTAFLHLQGSHLMAATTKAALHVWNITTRKLFLQKSIRSCLGTATPGIASACLAANGVPLIVLSEGGGIFFFSPSMDAWMRLSCGSRLQEALGNIATLVPDGPMAMLHRLRESNAPKLGEASTSNESVATTLEVLIGACLEMEASSAEIEYLRELRRLSEKENKL